MQVPGSDKGIGHAEPGDEVLEAAGIAHQREPGPDRPAVEPLGFEQADALADRRDPLDHRRDDLAALEVLDGAAQVIALPALHFRTRRRRHQDQRVVVGLEEVAQSVALPLEQAVPAGVARILVPQARRLGVEPVAGARRGEGQVFLDTGELRDRGMTAIGADHQVGAQGLAAAFRFDHHARNAIAVLHQFDDARAIAQFRAGLYRRSLDQRVDHAAPRAVGQAILRIFDPGIVAIHAGAEAPRWRRAGSHRIADADFVEHVHAGGVNKVRGHRHVAGHGVRIEHQRLHAAARQQGSERCARAAGADHDDVVIHGFTPMRLAQV